MIFNLGVKSKLNIDHLYAPDVKDDDFKNIPNAIENYIKSITEIANQLSILYLDYACCMDYSRMFYTENLKKATKEEIEKANLNFKHILPSQSLQNIKDKMGSLLSSLLKYSVRVILLYNRFIDPSVKDLIKALNKFKINPVDEYQNVYLEFQPFFSPNYLNGDYDRDMNLKFIYHIIKICEKLGFNLKEHLVKT